jgi:hypothetical protein
MQDNYYVPILSDTRKRTFNKMVCFPQRSIKERVNLTSRIRVTVLFTPILDTRAGDSYLTSRGRLCFEAKKGLRPWSPFSEKSFLLQTDP